MGKFTNQLSNCYNQSMSNEEFPKPNSESEMSEDTEKTIESIIESSKKNIIEGTYVIHHGNISEALFRVLVARFPNILNRFPKGGKNNKENYYDDEILNIYEVPKSSKPTMDKILNDYVVAALNVRFMGREFTVIRRMFSGLIEKGLVDQKTAERLYAWHLEKTMLDLKKQAGRFEAQRGEFQEKELKRLKDEEGITPVSEVELGDLLAQAIERSINSKEE